MLKVLKEANYKSGFRKILRKKTMTILVYLADKEANGQESDTEKEGEEKKQMSALRFDNNYLLTNYLLLILLFP